MKLLAVRKFIKSAVFVMRKSEQAFVTKFIDIN